VLKADLHTHSGEDPIDRIPYDARTLIDRASALGYGALAITLHDRQLPVDELTRYARARGVVLIPGIERTILGKHVLLLNFPADEAERIGSFDQLRALKRRAHGLVIAPHPFFPHPTSLGSIVDAHPDLFDAVERNAFYTKYMDFNRRAEQWARRQGRPVVGNGDVHRLRQLGRTFSMIDADPDVDSVCEAIREGRVSVSTEPMTADEAAFLLIDLLAADARRFIQRTRQQRRPERAPSESRVAGWSRP
jgi:predicted metal-dependent phosphoesterase TrpH